MNLREYIEAEQSDSNLFWKLSHGEIQNLLDEAVDEIKWLNSAAQQYDEACAAKIGGVLVYSTTGHTRTGGQIVGANGSGEFCRVYLGAPADAEYTAREHVRLMKQHGYNIQTAIFVPNDPEASYFGNPMKFVAAEACTTEEK